MTDNPDETARLENWSKRIPRYQIPAHNAWGEKVFIIRFVVFDEDAGRFPEFQTNDGREVISIDDDLTFFEIEGVRFKKGGPHSELDFD